jgi:phenylalanyl-tRNA synthetase beta chain
MLMQEVAGGKVSSEIKDVYPKPIEKWAVEISYNRVNRLIGNEIPNEIIKSILVDLNIEIAEETNEGLKLLIPTNKVDVTREADVIEEILRIYGFNNITFVDKINASVSIRPKPDLEKIQNMISDQLSSKGFSEIMNNSITNSDYYSGNEAFDEINNVKLLNALSQDLDVLRQSLLFGGLEVIAYNSNRKTSDLKLYEFGNIYLKKGDAPGLKKYNEQKHLSIFTSGLVDSENWNNKNVQVDFYYLKGVMESVLQRMGLVKNELEISEFSNANYKYALSYSLNGKQLAEVAELSKKLLSSFDIKEAVFVADVNWDAVVKALSRKDVQYKAVSKFPAVRRDLALLVDANVKFADLKAASLNTERKLLKSVGIFDIYKGDKIPEGKKSYALSFMLQDEEKTLTDKIIDKTMRRIQQSLEQEFKAELR